MKYITDWNPCELAMALTVAAQKLSTKRRQCRRCWQMLENLRPKISSPNVVLVLGCSEKNPRLKCASSRKTPVCRGEELLQAATLLVELPKELRSKTDIAVIGMIQSLAPCYGLLIGLAFRELCSCQNGTVRNDANKLAIRLDTTTESLNQMSLSDWRRSRVTQELLLLTVQIREFVSTHHFALHEDSDFALVVAEAQRLEQLKEQLQRSS